MMRVYRLIITLLILAFVFPAASQVNPREKIAAAIKAIQDNYVDSVKEEILVDAAIKGMMTVLDPHSHYLNLPEAADMKQSMSGSFYGIGVVFIIQNDSVFISEVIDEGPAQKAGIKPGDKILSIDGVNTASLKGAHSAIMKKIRGAKGTKVQLELQRDKEKQPLMIEVLRGSIPDRSVKSAFMVNDQVGYISLRIFNTTTRNDVDEALQMLQAKGMKSLILDLQQNGGGYVQSAFGVADEFLSRDQLVFYTKGHDGAEDYNYAAGTGKMPEGKLVVLIDEATASASEILSGALQDWDRAVLVGRRSFGKGLMQKPAPLFDGSVLQLTGARYYTPSGRSIQKPYKGNRYLEDNRAGKNQSPDSLKKVTLQNKRTVYGGGGIMPDYYVEADTLVHGTWFSALGRSGLLNEASFNYVNSNRNKLAAQYPDFNSFNKEFQVPSSQLKQLFASAEKNGLKLSDKDKKKFNSTISGEFKAQVAAQLFGNKEYLQVLAGNDEVFKKGLEIISNETMYNNFLKDPKSKTEATTQLNK